MNQVFSMNRRTLLRAGLGLAAGFAAPTLVGCATTGSPRAGFFAARNQLIGVQLYTLGDAAKDDLEGTLQRVADIGYRAVELPGLRVGRAAAIRAAADKAGVAVTSVHLGASAPLPGVLTVQDDAAQIAADLRVLGCRDVVLPFPLLPEVKPGAGENPRDAIHRVFATSTEHWERTAELLNARGALLQREGISLSYHNHDMEFAPVRGTRGWDVLVAQTDPGIVTFEVDVGWTVAAGVDPIQLIGSLGARVRALHVKDLNKPSGEMLKMDPTEVGSGVVDWENVLPAAYRAGVRQFYVEQEPPFKMDRFDAVAKSYGYLRSL